MIDVREVLPAGGHRGGGGGEGRMVNEEGEMLHTGGRGDEVAVNVDEWFR